jgi:hypothetical protein
MTRIKKLIDAKSVALALLSMLLLTAVLAGCAVRGGSSNLDIPTVVGAGSVKTDASDVKEAVIGDCRFEYDGSWEIIEDSARVFTIAQNPRTGYAVGFMVYYDDDYATLDGFMSIYMAAGEKGNRKISDVTEMEVNGNLYSVFQSTTMMSTDIEIHETLFYISYGEVGYVAKVAVQTGKWAEREAGLELLSTLRFVESS